MEAQRELLKECDYVLTQLETNVSAVERLAELAKETNTKVILNPAPVQPVSDRVLANVELITPNEVEAQILTGIPIDSKAHADEAADWFFARGVKKVLITLGERGVYIAEKERREILPAYRVKAVDTTGAGDAFNGGLVAALAEGKDLWESARFANALAALSVQRLGTTPAMPSREEIDKFLEDHPS